MTQVLYGKNLLNDGKQSRSHFRFMDCLEPPPFLYRVFTHSIHILSIPSYFIALFSLLFIKSKVFTTYRIFLIWHVIENVCFELYAAFLVLPAVHPPHSIIRTTGILSQMGITPIIQFYLLSVAIEFNGVSISEMFYFRYKASIINYQEHKFTNYMRCCIYFTRFMAILDPTFCVLTSDDAFMYQQQHIQSLHLKEPSAHFLTCPNVFLIVPFADYISTFLIVMWLLQLIIPFATVPGTVIYVNQNIQKSSSAATWNIQKQLLHSLTIQAVIHGVMLGIPNILFIYSFFSGYEREMFGYICLLLLTYHGFFSVFAMIIFTKPLREFVLDGLKLKKKTLSNKVTSSSFSASS